MACSTSTTARFRVASGRGRTFWRSACLIARSAPAKSPVASDSSIMAFITQSALGRIAWAWRT